MTPRAGLRTAAALGLILLPAAWILHAAGSFVQEDAPALRTLHFSRPITGADHERLLEQPFDVPPGTRRVEVEYRATGAESRTVVDLGLRGPAGLRGWSGGRQSRITVSALSASPGYLPGPIEPGPWAVVLGVPNIRPDRRDTIEITVRLDGREARDGVALPGRGPGWYVGDLHAHSGHSDGTSHSMRGARIGTPPHRVFDAAAAAGLDFLALTDHNTASHWLDVDRLQPFYDTLLLAHARELTTYRGHANAIGERAFHDFRLRHPAAAPDEALAGPARDGAFVSINHPRLPDDETCMGCGWNVTTPETLALVHGVEVVNGGAVEGPRAGWAFWAELLNRGFRMTAVGGSDDHTVDDDRDARLGRPATVVWMTALSEPALVEGLTRGRAYVRVRGPGGPTLETFSAARGGHTATMGETLAGEGRLTLHARLQRADGQTLQWIGDGRVVGETAIGDQPVSLELSAPWPRWVSLVVRDGTGPTLFSNAVYLTR